MYACAGRSFASVAVYPIRRILFERPCDHAEEMMVREERREEKRKGGQCLHSLDFAAAQEFRGAGCAATTNSMAIFQVQQDGLCEAADLFVLKFTPNLKSESL